MGLGLKQQCRNPQNSCNPVFLQIIQESAALPLLHNYVTKHYVKSDVILHSETFMNRKSLTEAAFDSLIVG
jgi:hypothetical protein